MDLSAEVVYRRLSEHFNVNYKAANNKNTYVGRPLYYEEDGIAEGHICIITPDIVAGKSLNKGVYVSIGDIALADSVYEIELLTVPDDIPVKTLFNKLQMIFDFYDDWEKRIKSVLEKDEGYQELICITCGHFNCSVTLVDENMNYIAYSKNHISDCDDLIQDDKISPSGMIELFSNPLFEKVIEENDIFEFALRGELFLCNNFRRNGKYIGRVILYCEKSYLKETYKFVLRALNYHIEVMLRKYGSFLNQNNDFSALRTIFCELLGNKNIDKQYLEHVFNSYNWNSNDEYILVRLQPEFRHEWQLHASYLIPLIERQWTGTCAVEYSDYVLVVVNKRMFRLKHEKDFKQELAYFIRDGLMMAGVSRTFTDIEHIFNYYRQTEIAVSMGMLYKPNGWCYYFDDYALHYWQKNGLSNFSPEQICSRVLLLLLEHDRENNTQFYETLVVLCKNNYNYSQAAKALFIHRTTFLYRMERIKEITHLDIENNDTRLYLELSYRYLEEYLDSSTLN